MSLIDSVQSGVSSISTPAFNGISDIQNAINGVTSSNPNGGNYVLIPPKGFPGGIGGFTFDYQGDDELTLESEITDHFAENNSSIQDHIALKPYRLILRGFVSELILPATSQGVFGALTTLQQKLGTVSAYAGKYTPQALQNIQKSVSSGIQTVQNYANEAAQYLNQAKNIAALLGGATAAPTKQQKTFVTLATMRDQRTIFSVLTPWVFLSNMAIESLVLVQPEDSLSKSDISVTMKQMRFVDVQSTSNYQANFQGPAAANYQTLTNLGSTAGTPVQVGNILSLSDY